MRHLSNESHSQSKSNTRIKPPRGKQKNSETSAKRNENERARRADSRHEKNDDGSEFHVSCRCVTESMSKYLWVYLGWVRQDKKTEEEAHPDDELSPCVMGGFSRGK